MKKSKFAQIDKERRGANVDATVQEVNKKAKIYVIIAKYDSSSKLCKGYILVRVGETALDILKNDNKIVGMHAEVLDVRYEMHLTRKQKQIFLTVGDVALSDETNIIFAAKNDRAASKYFNSWYKTQTIKL